MLCSSHRRSRSRRFLIAAPFFGQRYVRWATPAEREETISDSAVFVAVGLAMIVIGITIDSRYHLF